MLDKIHRCIVPEHILFISYSIYFKTGHLETATQD